MFSNYNISTERIENYDVVVVGGGIAGCSAAIASARGGAKTALIEAGGTLGGQAGIGLVTPLSSTHSKSGIGFGGLIDEILEETKTLTKKYVCANAPENDDEIFEDTKALTKKHVCASDPESDVFAISPQMLKYTLVKMLTDEKADIHFHTVLCDAQTDENQVKSIIVHDKSGFLKINAKTFIDATGDADLICLCKDNYVTGSEKNVFEQLVESGLDINHGDNKKDEEYQIEHLMQPVSLFFVMRGVDYETASKLNNKKLCFGDFGITKERFESWKFAGTPGFEITSERIPMPQNRVLISHGAHKDEAVVNMSRIININGADAGDLSKGEAMAQMQLIAIIDFLQTFIPGFENSYLVNTSSRLGVRETRRLCGKYILSGIEIINGIKFDDTICKGYYLIDIHDPRGVHGAIGGRIKCDYFEIPYRSICSKKFENLLACGRCISCDHVAHSATRIQGCCILTGQAAGTAGALAHKTNTSSCNLDSNLLREKLKDSNVNLD